MYKCTRAPQSGLLLTNKKPHLWSLGSTNKSNTGSSLLLTFSLAHIALSLSLFTLCVWFGDLSPKTWNASECVQVAPSFRVFRRTMEVPFWGANKGSFAKSISRNGLAHRGGRMPLWGERAFKYLSTKICFPAINLGIKDHHGRDKDSISHFNFCSGICYVLLLYIALLKCMEKTGKSTVLLISIPSFLSSFQLSATAESVLQSEHAAGDISNLSFYLLCPVLDPWRVWCWAAAGEAEIPVFHTCPSQHSSCPTGPAGVCNSFSPSVDKGREQRRDEYCNRGWGFHTCKYEREKVIFCRKRVPNDFVTPM